MSDNVFGEVDDKEFSKDDQFTQKYPATPLPPGMLATPDGELPQGEAITRPMFYMKIMLVELHCIYCKQKLYKPVILRSNRANPWYPDTFEVLTIILSKVYDFSHVNAANTLRGPGSYPCEGFYKAMRIWSEARIDDVRRTEFEGEYIRGSGEAIVPVIDV